MCLIYSLASINLFAVPTLSVYSQIRMPRRASIVNLAPAWKLKGRKGALDVTKFIQRRAGGHRKTERKTRSIVARKQPDFQKSTPIHKYGEDNVQQDDVFSAMKRVRDLRDKKDMDFELTPTKSDLFHLPWESVPAQGQGNPSGISLDKVPQAVEQSCGTSSESSPVRKERPRLPISRGSMFGRFKI